MTLYLMVMSDLSENDQADQASCTKRVEALQRTQGTKGHIFLFAEGTGYKGVHFSWADFYKR